MHSKIIPRTKKKRKKTRLSLLLREIEWKTTNVDFDDCDGKKFSLCGYEW